MAHSQCRPSGCRRGLSYPRGRWLRKGGSLPKQKKTARG